MKTNNKRRLLPGLKRIAIKIAINVSILIFAGLIWGIFNYRSAPSAGEPWVEPNHETTFFVEPLNAHGDVNFLEATSQHFSEGVTPENNALNKFIEVLVRNSEEYDPSALFERVGFEKKNLARQPFLGIEDWIRKSNKQNNLDENTVNLAFQFATKTAWTPDQFPQLNQWLEHNNESFHSIEQGLERERYFHPLLGIPGDSFEPAIMTSQLHIVEELTGVADYLEIRAMRSLGIGNAADAFNDLNRLYRLSELLHQGASSVEHQLAISYGERAYRGICVVAMSDAASEDDLGSMLESLTHMEPSSTIVESLNVSARVMILDAMVHDSRSGYSLYLKTMADHSESLKYINRWFDNLVDVVSIKDDGVRIAECKKIIDELKAQSGRTRNFLSGRKSLGKTLGAIRIDSMAPDFHGHARMEVQTKAAYRQTQIIVAAEILRRQSGSYPTSPDDVAKLLGGKIPTDPFNGKALAYEATAGTIKVGSHANPAIEINNQTVTWDEFKKENESKVADSISIQDLLEEVKKRQSELAK